MYFADELERNFLVTRLPKGALAEYLGVAPATLSKILHRGRPPTEREVARMQAFFSIVPREADGSFRWAVAMLRGREARRRPAAALAAFADTPAPAEVGRLLDAVAAGGEMRADQIVSLCVAGGIDLPTLVDKGEVRFAEGADRAAPFAGFETAARGWAERERAAEVYRLDPGTRPVLATTNASLTAGAARAAVPPAPAALLRRATAALPAAEGLSAYVVADAGLMPRFEEGDTIFLATGGAPPHNGDLVAALAPGTEPRVLALGRLLFSAAETVALRLAGGKRREFAASDIGTLARVVLAVF